MDYDGRNRKTILEKGIPYPYGIALYQDRLYWTDWKTWFVKIYYFHKSIVFQYLKHTFITYEYINK